MINQGCWFISLLIKQFKYCPPLSDIRRDVLIVGGGLKEEF